MKLFRVLPLVSVVALAACAADETPPPFEADPFDTPVPTLTFTKETINTPKHFSETVTVEEGKLTVPSDAQNDLILAKVVVGTILAAGRDTTDNVAVSHNKNGFLRQVNAIKREGANTVLSTTMAGLSDWIEEGDLDLTAVDAIFNEASAASSGVKTQGTPKKDESGVLVATPKDISINTEGKSTTTTNEGNFSARIGLTNSKVRFNASVSDSYFKARKKWGFPYGSKYRAHLTLDPVVTTDLNVDVQFSAAAGVATGGAETESIKGLKGLKDFKFGDFPGIDIPLGSIALMLQVMPVVGCSASASGSVKGTLNLEAKAHADFGVEGKTIGLFPDGKPKGIVDAPPSIDFTAKAPLGFTENSILTGSCSLQVQVGLVLFEAVSLRGAVGPYVSITKQSCKNQKLNRVEDAIWGDFGIDKTVTASVSPGGHDVVTKTLYNDKTLLGRHVFRGSNPDQLSCEEPTPLGTCKDKPDGFVCINTSAKQTNYGFLFTCKGGKEVAAERRSCPNGCAATSTEVTSCD
jgi:hypothetical protein